MMTHCYARPLGALDLCARMIQAPQRPNECLGATGLRDFDS
jgi:hypothetical protein